MNREKERTAIERLKAFEPETEPYYLCYSGGKDSDTIRILAYLAGVRHTIEHNLTTVDTPETVRYVKTIKGVHINRPKYTMWELIPIKKVPPTRLFRYCCEHLKEHGGKGRLKITGVRWDESINRAKNSDLVKIIGKGSSVRKYAEESGVDIRETPKGGIVLNYENDTARRLVEHCYRTTATMINPIIDWTEKDVWDFLNHYGCESNPLYQCGKRRIGCIGCPMQGGAGMKREFEHYPKYKNAYIRAFDRMVEARERGGLQNNGVWASGESVYSWWVGDDPRQITIFESLGHEDIIEASSGDL